MVNFLSLGISALKCEKCMGKVKHAAYGERHNISWMEALSVKNI